ncbi:MAG: diaminopimelate decarboxylase [Thermoleophilia bacterium]|nr:diaminopimelate decarboxylase [Thermoleophilia bacterium]
MFSSLQRVFPDNTIVDDHQLVLDGVSARDLAAAYGTPVTAISASHVRARARAWVQALDCWPGIAHVHYACKALTTVGLLQLIGEEHLGADVASGGELAVAIAAGIPGSDIVVHGNNKSIAELEQAVAAGVGYVVLDAADELELLATIAADAGRVQPVLVRVNPDIHVETHEYIATAHAGSKFGVAPASAIAMLKRANALPSLDAQGIHVHLGSQLLDLDAWRLVIDWLSNFARTAANAGLSIDVLDLGGGLGIAYEPDQQPPLISDTGALIVERMTDAWQQVDLPLPGTLIVEPGRSIVGGAGVTIYEVGVVKQDGPIGYVNVTGGMSDNPRPMLYKARYHALMADRADAAPTGTWWIAGHHCESGDVLIEDAELASPARGDLLAIAATGAYTVSMGSNYNMTPRGAVVMVDSGRHYPLLHAETIATLLARDAGSNPPSPMAATPDQFVAIVEEVTARLASAYPHLGRAVIAAASGAAMVGLDLRDPPTLDQISARAEAALTPGAGAVPANTPRGEAL